MSSPPRMTDAEIDAAVAASFLNLNRPWPRSMVEVLPLAPCPGMTRLAEDHDNPEATVW